MSAKCECMGVFVFVCVDLNLYAGGKAGNTQAHYESTADHIEHQHTCSSTSSVV